MTTLTLLDSYNSNEGDNQQFLKDSSKILSKYRLCSVCICHMQIRRGLWFNHMFARKCNIIGELFVWQILSLPINSFHFIPVQGTSKRPQQTHRIPHTEIASLHLLYTNKSSPSSEHQPCNTATQDDYIKSCVTGFLAPSRIWTLPGEKWTLKVARWGDGLRQWFFKAIVMGSAKVGPITHQIKQKWLSRKSCVKTSIDILFSKLKALYIYIYIYDMDS